MHDALRYILVAAGEQADPWITAALPRLADVNIAVPAAVVNPMPEKLRLAQQHLRVASEHCYADAYEALEKRRADFVILAVSPAQQEKLVELALTFDLNILSDGPVADSMEGACRVYRKVRGIHRKKMAVCAGRRFEQETQTLERALRANRYGRLGYIVGRFAHNSRRPEGRGRFRDESLDPMLAEAALGHFDILRALAGENVKSLHAISWHSSWVESRGDATMLVTMEMENGVHCLYEGAKANASALSGLGGEYFRAECENGTLEIDHRSLRLISGGSFERPRVDELALLEQPAWGRGYAAEMFCGWLAGGPAPVNTLKDHIYSAAMLFAAIESTRTGRTIDVKAYLQKHVEASRTLGASRGDD